MSLGTRIEKCSSAAMSVSAILLASCSISSQSLFGGLPPHLQVARAHEVRAGSACKSATQDAQRLSRKTGVAAQAQPDHPA